MQKRPISEKKLKSDNDEEAGTEVKADELRFRPRVMKMAMAMCRRHLHLVFAEPLGDCPHLSQAVHHFRMSLGI